MPEIKPFIPISTITHNTGTTQAALVPDVPREIVETKPEETKEKLLDSERFAALTKKEKAIQRRARELQERELRIAKWEDAEKLVGNNKLEALKRLGISYDELTNLHLSQMGADEQTPEAIAGRKAQEVARAELDAYKKEQEARNVQFQQQQYEAAKVQIKNEAINYTNSKPEEFAYINSDGAHDIIVELIEQEYFDTGKLIPVTEAAAEVEKYLESKYDKISQVPKFRSKYLTPQVEIEKPPSAIALENTQKPQTLTHKTTVAPPKPRTYTAAERRERAIRMMSGQPVD